MSAGAHAAGGVSTASAPLPSRRIARPGFDLPLFPVTVVGSLPRTDAVRAALRERAAGRLDEQRFAEVADEAVLAALRLQEEAGVDIVSDGEQRRESFYAFVARKLDGVRLLRLSDMLDLVEDKAAFDRLLAALDVPAFAIRNPVVDGRLALRGPASVASTAPADRAALATTGASAAAGAAAPPAAAPAGPAAPGGPAGLAGDEVAFLRAHTARAVKVALPGPYLLTRSMWLKRLSEAVYPTKEALAADVVALLRAEVQRLGEIGAAFVQLDEPALTEVAFAGPHATHTFMCAALSEKASPDEELSFAVDLINAVTDGARVRTGVHICRGNWSRRDDVLLAGSYDPLMPYLARMRVDQLVLEYATARAGSLDALRALPPERELGLGVVDPRTATVESPDAIVARVREALRWRAIETIFLNPDCGFGTFAERPVNSTAAARAKLSAIHAAALALRG